MPVVGMFFVLVILIILRRELQKAQFVATIRGVAKLINCRLSHHASYVCTLRTPFSRKTLGALTAPKARFPSRNIPDLH